MSDRLLRWANAPLSAPLIRRLGLPQPKVLPRSAQPYGVGDMAQRRTWLVAAPGSFAQEAAREALARRGVQWSDPADHATLGTLQTLVIDATGCTTAASLAWLHEALPAPMASLQEGARVVLLAPAWPQDAPAQAQACARGLEGFMRSLAKELGRKGATANLVQVSPSSVQALDLPLAFAGSDRSAYVSGQVLRVEPALAPAAIFNPAATALALNGQTAVVTGAAGGIGAATVQRLAAEGAHVVCVDVPAAQEALAVVAEAHGGTALALDITAPDAGAQLVQALAARGGADIVVHNAGITRDRTFARMSDVQWNAVLQVNLLAILAMDEALERAQMLRPGARAVYLASISGLAGNAGQTNYATTKAALVGYVQARAWALRPQGMVVNAVAPGFIETRMTARIPFMIREAGRRMNALSQGGLPEDVAEAITFLCQPAGAGINGQTLRVCGQSFLGA
jgi:3-oxoacyl-[acyl-carrier protein] reductase